MGLNHTLISAFVSELQKRLRTIGLNTSIVAKATTGSCYLSFDDERMGKVRVGDHKERDRYGYRWQIRTDISEPYTDVSKGHKQFFFPFTRIDSVVKSMEGYYKGILRNNGI